MYVKNLLQNDVKRILSFHTKNEFVFTSDKPPDAQYCLECLDVSTTRSLGIEYCLRNDDGLLLISEVLVDFDFHDKDVNDPNMQAMLYEVSSYLESVEHELYLANQKYHTNIKVSFRAGPARMHVLIPHPARQEEFTNAIQAILSTLSKLMIPV